ncbi:MAG: hypothetical protein ACFUZC_16565 [Chthoniobacteraceae bacterium]
MALNSSGLKQFRERCQTVEEALYPCQVSIDGGESVAGSMISKQPEEFALELGGPRPKQIQVFHIRKSYFASVPIAEQTMLKVEGGDTWRVQSVDGEQPSSPTWFLTCRKETR